MSLREVSAHLSQNGEKPLLARLQALAMKPTYYIYTGNRCVQHMYHCTHCLLLPATFPSVSWQVLPPTFRLCTARSVSIRWQWLHITGDGAAACRSIVRSLQYSISPMASWAASVRTSKARASFGVQPDTPERCLQTPSADGNALQ